MLRTHINNQVSILEYGIPINVINDDEPQYSSESYWKFAQQWKFNVIL